VLGLATPRGPSDGPSGPPRLQALELLSALGERVATSLDLHQTLEDIADAVVACLGFDAAVVNVSRADGVHVAVARGPQDMQNALLGTTRPVAFWTALLGRSQPRGRLRMIDGRLDPSPAGPGVWVPEIAVPSDPDSWHPHDALFAPLNDTAGELLGVLSVDLPRDGRRPSTDTLDLLERFAVLAGLAMERATTHAALTDSAALFQASFHSAPTGMLLLAESGQVLEANREAAVFFGLPDDQVRGRPCWELVTDKDVESVKAALAVVASTQSRHEGRVRDRTGTRTARVVTTPLMHRGRRCSVVQLDDITDRLVAERLLLQQATTDSLTGLANRASVRARLDDLAAHADRHAVGVLFCDLDHFKLVNDSFGHAVGDSLLVEVARTLRGLLREDDLVGRVGGDEFVIVLEDLQGPAEALGLAERIAASLRSSVSTAGVQVTPSCSIGIAYAEDATTADELLAQADAALYDAKAAGRGRWEVYTPVLRERARAQLMLREQLIAAVAGEQFFLEYQPIIDLTTGMTTGYEALLRWQHPTRGRLTPDAFLQSALDGPLANPLTDWILDRALGDAAGWPVEHGRRPTVSVNISPSQLHRADLLELLARLLQRHGLEADRVCIEVTEDAVVEGDRELTTLSRLRGLGFHVAVDDFGSGYAGLLSLRDVPADVIKLDRLFTDRLLTDKVSRHVVEVVVDLCQRLGRTIVAEGIETAEQALALRELGVQCGQGWHLGRPALLASGARQEAGPAQQVAMTGDLDGEMRRLQAALASTRSAQRAGELAVQAATRVVGCTAGSMVLLDDPTTLRTVYALGYPEEVVNRFRTFAVDAPLPLAKAVASERVVWLNAVPMVQHLHEVVPAREQTHVSLVAVPLLVDGRCLGALGFSWRCPVVTDSSLTEHLQQLTDTVALHLDALLPTTA
jgi:diguanylate cyclase (GGDEF)-like protein/PAS domain S-box-containing protein